MIAGIARAVLTSTGNNTEVGRIGRLTRSVKEESTPLERRLDALGRRLAVWRSESRHWSASLACFRGSRGG